ncbi:IclR family transcriptional regulator [Saccharopolyspora elongata]|uniref:MarR family transcriptional regulator n=1 Tax=Saccharopolyspora elongata TaxID=2530387 RepID=A0A4R4Z3T7_9PSEU|nr:helix-turn-helix domain-containing protein [Saccharopolyspora elongata]TDD51684.1 MarR family transcriptional regulator [Saccharopolyspora elongata]
MSVEDNRGSSVSGAQTLDRGIRVLWHLARRPDGETLTEMARSLGLNRNALHRMLEALTAHNLVRRTEDKRYHLAYGLVELASAVDSDLRGLAYPIMAGLADAVDATVHLMVPVSDAEVQAVLVVEPRLAAAHIAFRTGQRHAIDRGSGGIAILAGRPPRDDDPAEVVAAREQGYAVSTGHVIPGVIGVSVPVETPPTMSDVSIGVSLVDPAAVEQVAPRVVEAAREVSAQLFASRSRVR